MHRFVRATSLASDFVQNTVDLATPMARHGYPVATLSRSTRAFSKFDPEKAQWTAIRQLNFRRFILGACAAAHDRGAADVIRRKLQRRRLRLGHGEPD